MYDVVALGELVIDFSPGGVSAGNHALYERQPGGAPSNVLAAVARLGGKAAIMGMVGDDSFGYYLKDMAESCGIDCTGLCFTGDAYTTLAFVHLDSSGERSFTVMRKPGADTQLRKEQVRTDMIKQTGIFHVSAAALTDEPCREAAFYAAQYARQEKKPVSFDANYRDVLWDREQAIRIMKTFLPLVDILKVSEEEMTMLTGTTDIPQGAEQLYGGGISLVTVTCGEKGSYYCCQGGHGFVPAYQVGRGHQRSRRRLPWNPPLRTLPNRQPPGGHPPPADGAHDKSGFRRRRPLRRPARRPCGRPGVGGD